MPDFKRTISVTRSRKLNLSHYGGAGYETEDFTVSMSAEIPHQTPHEPQTDAVDSVYKYLLEDCELKLRELVKARIIELKTPIMVATGKIDKSLMTPGTIIQDKAPKKEITLDNTKKALLSNRCKNKECTNLSEVSPKKLGFCGGCHKSWKEELLEKHKKEEALFKKNPELRPLTIKPKERKENPNTPEDLPFK